MAVGSRTVSGGSAGNVRELTVLHAGLSLMTVNPLRLDESLKHIQAEVGPQAERVGGSLGVSLHVNTDLGIAVFETLWVSDDALRAGERVIAASRDEVVRRGARTLTAEQYAVPVFEQEAPVVPGAGVRLTRIDVAPSRVEDAIEVSATRPFPGWPTQRVFAARSTWSTAARGARSARRSGRTPRP